MSLRDKIQHFCSQVTMLKARLVFPAALCHFYNLADIAKLKPGLNINIADLTQKDLVEQYAQLKNSAD